MRRKDLKPGTVFYYLSNNPTDTFAAGNYYLPDAPSPKHKETGPCPGSKVVVVWEPPTSTPAPSSPEAADQKVKTASGKVPLNLIPLSALKGVARVFGYGAKKYKAGNYYTADDAEIANRYVGGFLRHLADSQRPDGLFDWASVAALDVESGLPEIDHALCGLIMLRSLAVKHGALPADPGVGNEPPAKVQ